MDLSETLALLAQGRDAWNTWAQQRCDEFLVLEKEVELGLIVRDPAALAQLASAAAADAVTFAGQVFDAETDFSGFVFPGRADFSKASFPQGAVFRDAKFLDHVNFDEAAFAQASVDRVALQRGASFRRAAFEGEAHFSSGFSTTGRIDFTAAIFRGPALFDKFRFSWDADFRAAQFDEQASFTHARFKKSADFAETRFAANTSFARAEFEGPVDFSEARMLHEFSLASAQFRHTPDFTRASFKIAPQTSATVFPSWTSDYFRTLFAPVAERKAVLARHQALRRLNRF